MGVTSFYAKEIFFTLVIPSHIHGLCGTGPEYRYLTFSATSPAKQSMLQLQS